MGLGIGLGLAIFAPGVVAAVAASARPLAKKGIKMSMEAMERGRENMGEAGEMVEDLFAEIKAEILEEREQAAAAAAAAAEAVQEAGKAAPSDA